MYDDLLQQNQNDYEIGVLLNSPGETEKSSVLDIGFGTGHHVSLMETNGMSAIGIDNSSAMVKQAKANYPQLDFREETVMDQCLYSVHIYILLALILQCIILMIKMFLENCYHWLMPGGCLLLNLVDKHKFDQ